MRVKTSELEGAALDYAVAKLQGWYTQISIKPMSREMWNQANCTKPLIAVAEYHPSINWSQGGPLIEKHLVGIVNATNHTPWLAMCKNTRWMEGPAPLIAAMRAIVAAELGDTVEVPDELVEKANG